MSDQRVRVEFDELQVQIGHLENYAQGIVADTKANPAVLAGYRTGYADGPFADVGDALGQGRELREKVGQSLSEEAGNQAEAHRNTIHGFTDADAANKSLMDNTGEGDLLAPNGVGRIDDFQGGSTDPSRGVQGPYDTNSPHGPEQVRPQMPPGVGSDAPAVRGPASTVAQTLGAVGPRPPVLDCDSLGSPAGDGNTNNSGPLPPGTPQPEPGTRRPGDWVPGEPPPPGWTPPRPPPLDRASLGERCYDPSAPPI